MTQLRDAVVLVTGAGGGFGRELTRQLLAAGSQLVLSDRDVELLPVADACDPPGPGKILATIAADLSQAAASDDLYDRIRDLHIAPDILINNAGIGMYGRLDEVPTADWERLLQVNLLAPMRLSARFARDAIARKSGHIVNISSLAGWVAPAGLGPYAASKFGLRGLSNALAAELRPYNVKVSAVYPFFSRTPILDSLQYGELATAGPASLSERWATDPARVMAATLAGIRRDRRHIFPDRPALLIHWIQRYFPGLVDWVTRAS